MDDREGRFVCSKIPEQPLVLLIDECVLLAHLPVFIVPLVSKLREVEEFKLMVFVLFVIFQV